MVTTSKRHTPSALRTVVPRKKKSSSDLSKNLLRKVGIDSGVTRTIDFLGSTPRALMTPDLLFFHFIT